jgi:hypothetical protein
MKHDEEFILIEIVDREVVRTRQSHRLTKKTKNFPFKPRMLVKELIGEVWKEFPDLAEGAHQEAKRRPCGELLGGRRSRKGEQRSGNEKDRGRNVGLGVKEEGRVKQRRRKGEGEAEEGEEPKIPEEIFRIIFSGFRRGL